MNLHPIVISENIRHTTGSTVYGRKGQRHGRAVWSMILIVWALGYFALRL